MKSSWPGFVIPPIIAVISFGLLWTLLKFWTGYPDYILPGPGKVLSTLWEHRTEVGRSTWITLQASAGGLACSVVGGSLIAILFSQAKWIRRGLYPLAIFFQTVPIVAIAPIVVLWLDEGLYATIFIAFVVSVFPIITNTTSGLLNVDNSLFELFRLYRASRWQRLIRLQIPSALPSFATGLKVASGLSVLGAVVGEFFCATLSNKGLGRQIFELRDQAPLMYACILAATTLGVVSFSVVSLCCDRFLLYWEDRQITRL